MDRFACPTPDRMGRYRCIDDHVLCDGFIDCPNGEDEDRQACMFYKTLTTPEGNPRSRESNRESVKSSAFIKMSTYGGGRARVCVCVRGSGV
ncbi:hypothetical protein RUM44_013343 [Polyplax serrata]|uniref:Uncharacterized protein n=1 Tax=Polyplax serrata TaxID=468196 RepID=A0ABR1BDX2_POLSC